MNVIILILVGILCYKQLVTSGIKTSWEKLYENNAVCEVSGASMQKILSNISSRGLASETSGAPSIAISETSVHDKSDNNCVR